MEKVLASGIAKPLRFHQFITFAAKVDPTTYVNFISRKDDCTLDRLEDKKRMMTFFPDLPLMNEVHIREDYESGIAEGKYGWYAPVLTIEGVFGSLSQPMRESIKSSYKFVTTIRFTKQFSSVFAMMTLINSLENCQEIFVIFNDQNIRKTTVDADTEAYGIMAYVDAAKNASVRRLCLLKTSDLSHSHLNMKSRITVMVKFAMILFPNLEELAIDTLGSLADFKDIASILQQRRRLPQSFLPHVTSYYNGRIIMKIDVTKATGPRAPIENVIAPENPPYMNGNQDFVYMGMGMGYFHDGQQQMHYQVTNAAMPSTSSGPNMLIQ